MHTRHRHVARHCNQNCLARGVAARLCPACINLCRPHRPADPISSPASSLSCRRSRSDCCRTHCPSNGPWNAILWTLLSCSACAQHMDRTDAVPASAFTTGTSRPGACKAVSTPPAPSATSPVLFSSKLLKLRSCMPARALGLDHLGQGLALVVVQLRHLLEGNGQLGGHRLDAGGQLLGGLLRQAGNGGVQLRLGGQVLALLELWGAMRKRKGARGSAMPRDRERACIQASGNSYAWLA